MHVNLMLLLLLLNLQVAISFRQAKSSWKTENVNLLILSKFKEWMSQLSESDVDFRHRATAICFMARSRVCMMLQHLMVMELHLLVPVYAQLGFRNYFTEVFCHVVNFTTKWPI